MNKILHNEDLKSIEIKLSQKQAELNAANNALRLAEVCSRTTKSEYYKSLWDDKVIEAKEEIKKLTSERDVFQSGYNSMLAKY